MLTNCAIMVVLANQGHSVIDIFGGLLVSDEGTSIFSSDFLYSVLVVTANLHLDSPKIQKYNSCIGIVYQLPRLVT